MTSFYFYYHQNPLHLSFHTVNLLLSTPGAYLFQTHLKGGGGVFNLEKTMASVLHKELEYIVEKLKGKRLEVMQPRIRIKSKLPVSK